MFGLEMNPVSVIPKQSAAEKAGTNWLKLNELQQLMGDFPKTPGVGSTVSLLLNLCVYADRRKSICQKSRVTVFKIIFYSMQVQSTIIIISIL